jgi:hypothetical protein
MINVVNIILSHNYLNFSKNFYQQEKGLVMCASFSAAFDGMFLQYMDCNNIRHLPRT